jgi:hypothetical protein
MALNLRFALRACFLESPAQSSSLEMLMDEPLPLLLDSSLLLLADFSRLCFDFFFAALRSGSPSDELLLERLLLALSSLDLFLPRLPRAGRSLAGLESLAFFFLAFSRSPLPRPFLPFLLSFLFFLAAGLRL